MELGEKDVKRRIKQLDRLRNELDVYVSTLHVLGFNSGKYDINLVRQYLYPALQKSEAISFIIKNGSSYQCIQSETLRFLDIRNYLAPGYNYKQFVKAYGGELGKGYFPYEWFDKAGASSSNIAEEEYKYYQQVWTGAEI